MNGLVTSAPLRWHVIERHTLDSCYPVLDIKLHYPGAWFAPLEQHPDALVIEERTIAWMRGLGLFSHASQEAVTRAMCPRFYGACPASMLSFDAALLFTQYVTMWLLWDDEAAECAASFDELEADFLAMSGTRGVQPDEPAYRRAWREIGDGIERLGGSPALRQRWVDAMRHYARDALVETRFRSLPPDEDRRAFDSALQMRLLTIGVLPAIVYLEACCGIEMPAILTETPAYQRFVRAASMLQALQNDLASLPKDGRKREIATNMVLRYQRDHDCSLRDACDAILRLHDSAMQTFDELAETLCEHPENSRQPHLAAYFEYARYMETGFGFYHTRADRYTQQVIIEDRHAFRPVMIRR
jgi:hypothetical protein